MKSNSKKALFHLFFSTCMILSTQAQSKDCGGPTGSQSKSDCKIEVAAKNESTSGCSPSSCRGAKTKFGEAKVISNLRGDLIALKAAMENSSFPKFEARSYDIHGIVGENDDESLKIIVDELKIMEKDFSVKTTYSPVSFDLPKTKAKQIAYLENRIDILKKNL